MKHYPVVLSIAGSDCSGGAGIQADIKTISALGGYAASAITAVTVQNTVGVRAVHVVPAEIVCGQIEAVMEDLHPDAIKIGMVSEEETVRAIADCLRKFRPEHVVYNHKERTFSTNDSPYPKSGRSRSFNGQKDCCIGRYATSCPGTFGYLPDCRINKRGAFAGR